MTATVTMTKSALEAAVKTVLEKEDSVLVAAPAAEMPKALANAIWNALGGRAGG